MRYWWLSSYSSPAPFWPGRGWHLLSLLSWSMRAGALLMLGFWLGCGVCELFGIIKIKRADPLYYRFAYFFGAIWWYFDTFLKTPITLKTTKNRDPQGFISACESRSLLTAWVDRDRTYDYGFRVHCVTTSLLPSNLTTSNILKKNRALVNDFFDEGAKKLILA